MRILTLRRLLQMEVDRDFRHPRLGRVTAQQLANHYSAALDAQVVVIGQAAYFAGSPTEALTGRPFVEMPEEWRVG